MSLFLSTAQLARERADMARMLPDTCVIMLAGTAQITRGSAGGWTETATPATAGTVACSILPANQGASPMLDEASLQEVIEVVYQLTVPYDAPLAPNCKVVSGGRTYEVVKLDMDHSWRAARRALIVEMR